MRIEQDLNKRKLNISLTENEATKLFKDLDGLDSCNYKTTIDFIKELKMRTLIFEFIIKELEGSDGKDTE